MPPPRKTQRPAFRRKSIGEKLSFFAGPDLTRGAKGVGTLLHGLLEFASPAGDIRETVEGSRDLSRSTLRGDVPGMISGAAGIGGGLLGMAVPGPPPRKAKSLLEGLMEEVDKAPVGRGPTRQEQLLQELAGRGKGGKEKIGKDIIGKIERVPGKISGAARERLGIKIDNPGGEWLQNKLIDAKRARIDPQTSPNTFRKNIGTSDGITGFVPPIEVNPQKLKKIAGAMGEERFIPGDKLAALERSIASEGFKPEPILIMVREDGVPFVVEGNNRLFEAIKSGRASIPVEVKYLRGAESVRGPLNPNRLAEFVVE